MGGEKGKIISFFIKKRGPLIAVGCFVAVTLITICFVMPLAFGASLGEMMLVWAPYSFSGGLIMLAVCTFATVIRIIFTHS